MKILTIDRSKWRTGGNESEHKTGDGTTQLLNHHGFMCCLGFYCEQSGVNKDRLLYSSTPVTLDDDNDDIRLLVTKVDGVWSNYRQNTKFSEDAIFINDETDITSEERENKLTEHFASVGIEVVFVGEYYK